MKAPFFYLAAFVLVSSGAHADVICKNVVFADANNEFVVFFHSREHETALTEVRHGKGQICSAKWFEGLSLYDVKCPDGTSKTATMRYERSNPIGIEYGDIFLDRQCAQ